MSDECDHLGNKYCKVHQWKYVAYWEGDVYVVLLTSVHKAHNGECLGNWRFCSYVGACEVVVRAEACNVVIAMFIGPCEWALCLIEFLWWQFEEQ